MKDTTHAVYFVGLTIIAMLTIYFAWDREDGVPMMQFALVFGGALLGHITTEVLNATEED
jgi:lipoprotein signal peptidase